MLQFSLTDLEAGLIFGLAFIFMVGWIGYNFFKY